MHADTMTHPPIISRENCVNQLALKVVVNIYGPLQSYRPRPAVNIQPARRNKDTGSPGTPGGCGS